MANVGKKKQSLKTAAASMSSGERGRKSTSRSSKGDSSASPGNLKAENERLHKLLLKSMLYHQATRESHGIDKGNPKLKSDGGGDGSPPPAADLVVANGDISAANTRLKKLLVKSMLAHQATLEDLGIDNTPAAIAYGNGIPIP